MIRFTPRVQQIIAFVAIVAVVPLGVSATSHPVQAQGGKPLWSVRYVVLTATPLPGVPGDLRRAPAIFDSLERGTGPKLTSNPNDLILALVRSDPRFRYQVVLYGISPSDADGNVSIKAGPAPGNPDALTVTDQIKISAVSATTANIACVGRLEGGIGPQRKIRRAISWDLPPQPIVYGRTQGSGVLTDAGGKHLHFVFSVIKGGG
jgi:hypothetical protein